MLYVQNNQVLSNDIIKQTPHITMKQFGKIELVVLAAAFWASENNTFIHCMTMRRGQVG